MNVLYVCRGVDEEAPFTAAQVQWISTLAQSPPVRHVHVLTTRSGRATLPDNVTVRQLSRHGTATRLVLSFWWEVLRARPFRQNFFFVAQGGPFPALLLPFKLVARRPIYQWKAQPHVSARMRFYAKYCNNLTFTATEQSLLLSSPRKRVIGHGIDTRLFVPSSEWPDRDLVTVGRLSPIKHIDRMIVALARCRHTYGSAPRLDVVGQVTGKSRGHAEELRSLVERLELQDTVRFLGHVDYGELPELLPRYRALLNFSQTAFDKSVGEAMACGVPVLTANPSVIEDLPADLLPYLATHQDDVTEHARALHRVLSWDDRTHRRLRERVRDHVVAHHSLESFFGKIFEEIAADRGAEEGSLVVR